LGLAKANAVDTPCTPTDERKDQKGNVPDVHDDRADSPALDPENTTRYRAVAARLNYLAQDRPDLKYSVMRACACMSAPREGDMNKLKRIGRYLLRYPRAICLFAWQRKDSKLVVHTDSDWAGDRETRRSVSSGVMMHGSHVIETWSKQQAIVATSSQEAELYALCRGASETLGAQSYAADLGERKEVEVHTDSSAALSLTQRVGLGKAKHIAIQWLWIQGAVKDKKLVVLKVPTEHNPGDIGTKALAADRIAYLMDLAGFVRS
jgi:hypothetical protein